MLMLLSPSVVMYRSDLFVYLPPSLQSIIHIVDRVLEPNNITMTFEI